MKNIDLIKQHDDDTMFCSFEHHMKSTSSTYKQIIEIGKDAVPDILNYIRDEENAGMSIMLLLWDILKISPYEPEVIKNENGEEIPMLGFDVLKAKQAWIDWGIKEKLIEKKEEI